MDSDRLLLLNGVDISGLKVPDVLLSAGDILWLEVDNELYSDVFVSFLLGLLEPNKGKALLSGKSIKDSRHKTISYVSFNFTSGLEDIESFVKLTAYSYNLYTSKVLNEFKRILGGIGASYAVDMEIDKMTTGTRRRVATAISLSMPLLLVVLIEPYSNLDEDETVFLKQEIDRLILDGTSVIILSETSPPTYSKHEKFSCRVL